MQDEYLKSNYSGGNWLNCTCKQKGRGEQSLENNLTWWTCRDQTRLYTQCACVEILLQIEFLEAEKTVTKMQFNTNMKCPPEEFPFFEDTHRSEGCLH